MFSTKQGLSNREIQIQQSVNELGRERAAGSWEAQESQGLAKDTSPKETPPLQASTQADCADTGEVAPLLK